MYQQFNNDLSGRNGLTGFRAFVEAGGTTRTMRCAKEETGKKWAALVNLKILYLSRNQIADLTPLSALVNLKGLGLGGIQIADDGNDPTVQALMQRGVTVRV